MWHIPRILWQKGWKCGLGKPPQAHSTFSAYVWRRVQVTRSTLCAFYVHDSNVVVASPLRIVKAHEQRLA